MRDQGPKSARDKFENGVFDIILREMFKMNIKR